MHLRQCSFHPFGAVITATHSDHGLVASVRTIDWACASPRPDSLKKIRGRVLLVISWVRAIQNVLPKLGRNLVVVIQKNRVQTALLRLKPLWRYRFSVMQWLEPVSLGLIPGVRSASILLLPQCSFVSNEWTVQRLGIGANIQLHLFAAVFRLLLGYALLLVAPQHLLYGSFLWPAPLVTVPLQKCHLSCSDLGGKF
jgi:hypothetical protein